MNNNTIECNKCKRLFMESEKIFLRPNSSNEVICKNCLFPSICGECFLGDFLNNNCIKCQVIKDELKRLEVTKEIKQGLEKFQKQPLGLKPRWLHIENRIKEITEVITRYFNKNKPIPIEWVDEYNSLVNDPEIIKRINKN